MAGTLRLIAAAVLPMAFSAVCKYDFPDRGVSYDFSSQAGRILAYHLSSSQDYRFSLCSDLPGFTCAGDISASVLLDRVNGSICTSSYGKSANTTVALLSEDASAGIRITIAAGSPCPAGGGRTLYTVFNLACDPSAITPSVRSMASIPLCGIVYNMGSALACGRKYVPVTEAPSAGWIIFLSVVGAGCVYLVGGVLYKRRVYGATGFEAVPNIGTWRALYGVTFGPLADRFSRQQPREDDYTLAEEEGEDIKLNA